MKEYLLLGTILRLKDGKKSLMINVYKYLSNNLVLALLLALICVGVVFSFGGCSIIRINEKNNINDYLQQKYHEDFTFVQDGSESMFSGFSSWKYSNMSGSEFSVKINNETKEISDNYQSIVFDKEVSKYISKILQNKYVVTSSSTTHYTTKYETFICAEDYLNSLNVVNVDIFTNKDWGEYFTDIDKLKNLSNNKCVVHVAQLDSQNMDKIAKDPDAIISSGKLKTSTYIIENNHIEKSK